MCLAIRNIAIIVPSKVQKKTLNVKSVFDDRYDYQGENEVPVKTADIEDKKGAEMN